MHYGKKKMADGGAVEASKRLGYPVKPLKSTFGTVKDSSGGQAWVRDWNGSMPAKTADTPAAAPHTPREYAKNPAVEIRPLIVTPIVGVREKTESVATEAKGSVPGKHKVETSNGKRRVYDWKAGPNGQEGWALMDEYDVSEGE